MDDTFKEIQFVQKLLLMFSICEHSKVPLPEVASYNITKLMK